MKHLAILIGSIVLSAGVLTACGDSDSAESNEAVESSISNLPTTSAAEAQPTGDIVIDDYKFTVPASVTPGQEITVVNNDDASHSLVPNTNNAFAPIRVSGGGGTATFTAPTTPGSYPFFCEYHEGMNGTLIVG